MTLTNNGADYYFSAANNSDFTTALLSALSSITTAGGGRLHLPSGYFLLSSSIAIPVSIELNGALAVPGELPDLSYKTHGTTLGFSGSALSSSNTAAICLEEMSRISNVTLLNSDLTYPISQVVNYSSGQNRQLSMTVSSILQQISNYKGTAIFHCGRDSAAQDVLIIGFNQAIDVNPNYYWGAGSSVGGLRGRNIKFDCTNGIRLQKIDDLCYYENCHGWQFLTGHVKPNPSDPDFQTATTTTANYVALSYRSGTAFTLANGCDGAHFINCFSYGWQIGGEADVSTANVAGSFLNCGFDTLFNYASGTIHAGVAQTYSTVGIVTYGSYQLDLGLALNGGAQGIYAQFQHSGSGTNVNGQAIAFGTIEAGECVTAWIDSFASSKIDVDLNAFGSGGLGIHFRAGIGDQTIRSYVLADSLVGNLYTLDQLSDLSRLELYGASIDINSKNNGAIDNLGIIRRDALRRNQPVGAYALALPDINGFLYFNSGSTQTWTIPANTAVPFPIGAVVTSVQYPNTGTLILQPGSGVTVIWAGNTSQGSRSLQGAAYVRLLQLDINYWIIEGGGIH